MTNGMLSPEMAHHEVDRHAGSFGPGPAVNLRLREVMVTHKINSTRAEAGLTGKLCASLLLKLHAQLSGTFFRSVIRQIVEGGPG